MAMTANTMMMMMSMAKMAQDGARWRKMAQDGARWCKMAKMVQNAQDGQDGQDGQDSDDAITMMMMANMAKLIEVNKSSLVFPVSSHKKGRRFPCEHLRYAENDDDDDLAKRMRQVGHRTTLLIP
ncbi:hypothetical protein GQR58_016870 [Nymphon striatum]|nr:hypothetical protein GQR58_016870 [Nymphon striatum]